MDGNIVVPAEVGSFTNAAQKLMEILRAHPRDARPLPSRDVYLKLFKDGFGIASLKVLKDDKYAGFLRTISQYYEKHTGFGLLSPHYFSPAIIH